MIVNNFKLSKIKKGFTMQTPWGSKITPKRYRIGKSKSETVMFISFKLRGNWIPWKRFN